MTIDEQLERLAAQERSVPVPRTDVAESVKQTIRLRCRAKTRTLDWFAFGIGIAAMALLTVTIHLLPLQDEEEAFSFYEPESYVYADLDDTVEMP